MVVERSAFYHLRKQVAIWIYPALAGTVIFLDWNNTRLWKSGKKINVLDEILGSEQAAYLPKPQQKVLIMGTFTFSYLAKKIFLNDPAHYIFVPALIWFSYCWNEAGIYKRSMMKGHSKMYADRLKSIPSNHHDPWKW
uniref:Uncharacterized protein n=1 Tax=Panagrolaimus superbus TaxID=310955 RepID=A0A914Y1I5_9BILA